MEDVAGGPAATLEAVLAEWWQRKAGREAEVGITKNGHKSALASTLLSGAWCWLGKQCGCHPKGTNPRFHLEFVWITPLHGFSCIHKSVFVPAEAASQAWKGNPNSASF